MSRRKLVNFFPEPLQNEKRGGMKHPNINKQPGALLLFVLVPMWLILFCAPSAFASSDGVMAKIKAANQKMDKNSQVDTSIPLPKNAVQTTMEYQGGKFYTQTRKNEISRYKCSSCHNDKIVSIKNAAAISHNDIKIVHGEKDNPLACDTCHNKDDRDFLKTSKADKIDMDHVYNMCGECHFRQKKDWVGGAHGQRVSHWAGERVVKNCTSCHNPHSPLFKKKWPKTYSVPLK